MRYARAVVNTTTYADALSLLDELDRTMAIRFDAMMAANVHGFFRARSRGTLKTWYECASYHEGERRDTFWHDSFTSFTVRHGLTCYVESKLQQHGSTCIHKEGRPLLSYACDPQSTSGLFRRNIQPELVALLLQFGADANQGWGSQNRTSWQNTLRADFQNPMKRISVVNHFVQHGADIHALRDDDEKYWKE